MNKKLVIITLVIIISIISFARSFFGFIGVIPWHYGYSDIFNEDRINPALAQKIPYLEAPLEYPLITGFFIYLMWYLGKTLLGYAAYTGIFLTLFTVITALVLYKLAELLGAKDRIWQFFIFAPSLVVFSVYNWDIIAVMFTVLAIYFFCKKDYAYSSLFLSLGFNAKLFPILFLPIMLMKTDVKQGMKIASIFIISTLALNAYFMLNSFDIWKATYTFHSSRGPNTDSIWALTGLSTPAVNILSTALFLLSYLLLIFNSKKFDFIGMGLLAMLLFLLFNKIASPQYLLWLLPFFVLSEITRVKFYLLEGSNLAVLFSTLVFILGQKGHIFLILSNISTIARSLILAFFIWAILKESQETNINTFELPH